jgi:hypothetical protein
VRRTSNAANAVVSAIAYCLDAPRPQLTPTSNTSTPKMRFSPLAPPSASGTGARSYTASVCVLSVIVQWQPTLTLGPDRGRGRAKPV